MKACRVWFKATERQLWMLKVNLNLIKMDLLFKKDLISMKQNYKSIHLE